MEAVKETKMKRISNKKKAIVILIAMIAVQLAVITYFFGWKREGYHADENWQYGFANAYYEHQICEDDNGNLKNFDEWKDGQVVRNYLEVQSGQQFQFGSVAHNMSVDLSPPLSNMILHAVCSFFPDTFSWWYAFGINAFFFVVTMIALYLLGRELMSSRKKALIICFLYGCTTAAINCFAYLRMYSMLTAFAVLLTYFYCRAYNKKYNRVIPEFIFIAVITFLGGLTHYYFYLLAFFMTGGFILHQLFTKKWKSAIINSVMQLGAVGLAFFVWPVTVNKAKGGPSLYGAEIKMPFLFDLELSVHSIVGETTGIPSYFPNIITWTYMWIGAIFLLIVFAGVSFVFRHEEKYWNFWKKIGKGIKGFFVNLPHNCRVMKKHIVFLILAIDATVLVIVKLSNIFLMGRYADRYYFYLMPLFVVAAVYVVDKFLAYVLKGKGKKYRTKILCLLTLLCVMMNHILFPFGYTIPTGSDIKLPELTKDSNVIMVLNDEWQLTTFSSLIRDCNQFFAVLAEHVMDDGMIEKMNSMPDSNGKKTYLLVERDMLMPEEEEYTLFGVEFDEEVIKQRFLPYKESEVLAEIQNLSNVESLQKIDEMTILQRDLAVYEVEIKG